MKAMLLRVPNIPFELIDWPDPVAGPGEAVAHVLTCGSGLTIQTPRPGDGASHSRASSTMISPATLSRSAPA